MEFGNDGYEAQPLLHARYEGAEVLKDDIDTILRCGEGRRILERLERKEISANEAASRIMEEVRKINVNDGRH